MRRLVGQRVATKKKKLEEFVAANASAQPGGRAHR
jgi:hypothetical protein